MRLPPANDDLDGPNLTPVIDIVFLLLIFFLVATQFSQQEKLVSIRLAEVLQAQPLAMGPKEVVVNITKEGKLVIYDETLSESQLISTLAAIASKNPGQTRVQIRADQEVKFRYPLTVIGICKQHDIDYSVTVLEKQK